MSRTSRSVPALALAALLAGFVLTGCSDSKSGAAAVVDGERIDISTLNSRVEKAADARESVGAAPVAGVTASQRELVLLLQSKVLDEAAERSGIVVTPTDIAEQKAEWLAENQGVPIEESLAERGVPASGVDAFTRSQIIIERLVAKNGSAGADKLYTETAGAMEITVNPRYGKWDVAEGLVPMTYSWLTPDSTDGDAPAGA